MAARNFRNKTNKTNKTNKRKKTNKGKKNKTSSLKAGAPNYRSIVYAQKNVIQDLKQQNQVLQSQVSQQSNLIQGLKGQNSVYSSDQSTGNGNMIQVLNSISQSQQKILKLLSTELNKKSPDINEVNRLVSLNNAAATTVQGVVNPQQTPNTSPSPSSSPSYALPAATGVAAPQVLSNAAQANSDAANDLAAQVSNTVGAIASPENIQAGADLANRATKGIAKALKNKDVQKHAMTYARAGLASAGILAGLIHKGANGTLTADHVSQGAKDIAGHAATGTGAAIGMLSKGYAASKVPSAK